MGGELLKILGSKKKDESKSISEEDEFFTEEEKALIKNRFNQQEAKIIEDYNPTPEQKTIITKIKKRLFNLLNILTKKEWFLLGLSNAANIFRLLGAGFEKAKEFIFEITKQIPHISTKDFPTV